jgi:hypothetical protein
MAVILPSSVSPALRRNASRTCARAAAAQMAAACEKYALSRRSATRSPIAARARLRLDGGDWHALLVC